MKIKSTLLVTCALGLMMGTSSAWTMAIARGTGNPGIVAKESVISGGALLSSGGYYIACGTYTNALGATEEPTITDYTSLLAAVAGFDVFASGTTPASGLTMGTLALSATSTGAPDATVFQSKLVYVLVGNKSSAILSDQWGIFKMTTPVFFPAAVGGAGNTAVPTATGASITPLTNAGTVVGNNLILVSNAIPEPSAALLGALGALGLLRRRRI